MMRFINRILTVIAIILGLCLIVWMTSQIDIDTGRNLHKWEQATAGVVQE